MTKITFPTFNREAAADQLDFLRTLLPALLAQARGGAHHLNGLYSSAIEYAGGCVALEPASAALPMVAEIAGQAQAALFARISAPPGQSVHVPLGEGPPVEYTSAEPDSVISPGDWTEGFHCALFARDGASLDRLCATPVDRIRQALGRSPEWTFLQVAAYQSFWLRKDDFVDRLLAALDAADPARIRADFAASRLSAEDVESIVRFALMRDVPTMKLLTRVIQGDAGRFNEALREALELHNRWVLASMVEKAGSQDSSWFFASGPLAMVSLAVDKGLVVTVESDYLPPGAAPRAY